MVTYQPLAQALIVIKKITVVTLLVIDASFGESQVLQGGNLARSLI